MIFNSGIIIGLCGVIDDTYFYLATKRHKKIYHRGRGERRNNSFIIAD
jgi:hypothetical protein